MDGDIAGQPSQPDGQPAAVCHREAGDDQYHADDDQKAAQANDPLSLSHLVAGAGMHAGFPQIDLDLNPVPPFGRVSVGTLISQYILIAHRGRYSVGSGNGINARSQPHAHPTALFGEVLHKRQAAARLGAR